MTELDARQWLEHTVSRGTMLRMEAMASIVRARAVEQNLVSAKTLDTIWARHFVDSAQLHAHSAPGAVLDIGSGAGFPGLVMAMMREAPFTLAEPRRLRACFLAETAQALGLDNVTVVQRRTETMTGPPFATIVARAVAPLAALFAMAEHVSDGATRWVLPKGRGAQSELAAARETWHGNFRLVNSVSDPAAAIIVATGVRRRAKRRSGEAADDPHCGGEPEGRGRQDDDRDQPRHCARRDRNARPPRRP